MISVFPDFAEEMILKKLFRKLLSFNNNESPDGKIGCSVDRLSYSQQPPSCSSTEILRKKALIVELSPSSASFSSSSPYSGGSDFLSLQLQQQQRGEKKRKKTLVFCAEEFDELLSLLSLLVLRFPLFYNLLLSFHRLPLLSSLLSFYSQVVQSLLEAKKKEKKVKKSGENDSSLLMVEEKEKANEAKKRRNLMMKSLIEREEPDEDNEKEKETGRKEEKKKEEGNADEEESSLLTELFSEEKTSFLTLFDDILMKLMINNSLVVQLQNAEEKKRETEKENGKEKKEKKNKLFLALTMKTVHSFLFPLNRESIICHPCALEIVIKEHEEVHSVSSLSSAKKEKKNLFFVEVYRSSVDDITFVPPLLPPSSISASASASASSVPSDPLFEDILHLSSCKTKSNDSQHLSPAIEIESSLVLQPSLSSLNALDDSQFLSRASLLLFLFNQQLSRDNKNLGDTAVPKGVNKENSSSSRDLRSSHISYFLSNYFSFLLSQFLSSSASASSSSAYNASVIDEERKNDSQVTTSLSTSKSKKVERQQIGILILFLQNAFALEVLCSESLINRLLLSCSLSYFSSLSFYSCSSPFPFSPFVLLLSLLLSSFFFLFSFRPSSYHSYFSPSFERSVSVAKGLY
jgi:hypothetical protein